MAGFNLLGINSHSEDNHFKPDASVSDILEGASENMNSFKEVEQAIEELKAQGDPSEAVKQYLSGKEASEQISQTVQDVVANSGYLTEDSLKEYAKTSDLFDKDYNGLKNLPTIPSIEGLASEKWVQEQLPEEYDDSELVSRIAALEAKPSISEKDVNTKISEAINAAMDGNGDFDSFKEISEWIETHGKTATEMVNGINENSKAIEDLQNSSLQYSKDGERKLIALNSADAIVATSGTSPLNGEPVTSGQSGVILQLNKYNVTELGSPAFHTNIQARTADNEESIANLDVSSNNDGIHEVKTSTSVPGIKLNDVYTIATRNELQAVYSSLIKTINDLQTEVAELKAQLQGTVELKAESEEGDEITYTLVGSKK